MVENESNRCIQSYWSLELTLQYPALLCWLLSHLYICEDGRWLAQVRLEGLCHEVTWLCQRHFECHQPLCLQAVLPAACMQ